VPVSTNSTLATKLHYDTSYFALGLLTQITVGSKTPTNLSYYTSTGNGGIAGMVASVLTPQPGSASGSGSQVTTTYTYTSLGNIATVKVPSPDTSSGGQVTYTYSYVYDGQTFIQNEALGEPVTVTDPVGNVTHYRWDVRGNLLSVEDASNNTTYFVYNDDDQITQITFADGSYIQYSYAYLGGPALSAIVYNSSGTAERTIGDTPGLEGETLKQTGDAEKGSAAYDALYRFKQLQDGNQDTTTYQFDPVSNLQYLTFPNYVSSTHYDQMEGRLYDNDYNLETFVDGLNRATRFIWNNSSSGDDSLTSIAFPSSPTRTFSYDGYGRVIQVQEGSGTAQNTYAYDYDDLDHITEVDTTYSNVGGSALLPTIKVSYGFNNDGSRASMEIAWTNNSNNYAYSFSYSYFANGLLQTVTLPWKNAFNTSVNETLNYTYFPNDWLKTQADSLVDSAYTYTPRGFLASLDNEAANPPQGQNPQLSTFTSGTYDASGNLVNMTWNVPLQANNVNGNYAPLLASNSTMTYGYHNEDFLTSESSPRSSAYNASYSSSYTADSADNLTGLASLTLGFNADNQIDSSSNSGATYSYDGDGNPTTYYWQDPHGSGTHNLSVGYDDQDWLTSFSSYFTASSRPDGLRVKFRPIWSRSFHPWSSNGFHPIWPSKVDQQTG